MRFEDSATPTTDKIILEQHEKIRCFFKKISFLLLRQKRRQTNVFTVWGWLGLQYGEYSTDSEGKEGTREVEEQPSIIILPLIPTVQSASSTHIT